MSATSERQAAILERVRSDGYVRVADVATHFGVSLKTVRRDLRAMEQRDLLSRVHGGAMLVSQNPASEPAFVTKASLQHDEKVAIAEAARTLIEPGMSVGLSAGTTTFEVARRLMDVPGLNVVTNSLPIATHLHEHGRDDLTLVVTGGIPTPTDALVGPLALASLAALHLDLVILGASGLGPRSGVSTPNMLEADTDRAFCGIASTLIVVADHTKWGSVGVSSKASLHDVDVLISDEGLPGAARAELERYVGRLIVAQLKR